MILCLNLSPYLKTACEIADVIIKVSHLYHSGGCGRLVFKVSNHGWLETCPSPVPLNTRQIKKRCTLNLLTAQMSFRCTGVVVRPKEPKGHVKEKTRKTSHGSRSIGSSGKFRANAERRNVFNHRTRFQRTGEVTRQPVSGRQRVATPRQDQYFVISARRQRDSTTRALGSALTVTTRIRISRQTVYRRFNHAALYARRPAVFIPLTSMHKRASLNCSLKHQH
ncbi:transposable element Tcb2 transposase [Trichonephila clavipes]|nr:transposable element Tcb2 transposase [Trichonephila clavipes]